MIDAREIVSDNFAGGGGASTGIEWALGRSPDIAVNHDAAALAVHEANHPSTRHYREDVWRVDPVEACGGRPVGLAWFSPDCRHFSRCKHGAKLSNKIRGLAWVATKWARLVRPRIIILENVEEWLSWGPLDDEGLPIEKRAGETYKRWHRQLRSFGYEIETRTLVAADYGAPTTRKRLFLIARCDGMPICWPTPTHGIGLPNAWRSTHEIIDWSLPVPSIFERRKPLADPTLRRIAHGIHRYVLGASKPFVRNGYEPTLIHSGNGERKGQSPRVYDLNDPLGTVVAQGVKHALIAAFMTKHYGGVVGHDLHRPIGTVTATDHHALTTASLERGDHREEAAALLAKYGSPRSHQRDLFGALAGHEERTVYDIGHRMLSARELFRAQGFPDSYVIDPVVNGKRLGSTAQIRLAGNSVCPHLAAALVRANVEQRAQVAA